MKYSNEFIENQKKILLQERERLENEIDKLEKYPDYNGQSEDSILELTDYEANVSIEEQLQFLLKKVNAALKSIEDGQYGLCRECGGAIEEGRLQVLPYADLCVTCRSKSEEQ